MAQELSNSGLKVVLLESGGLERQSDIDALDDIENVGRPRAKDQWSVRNRILGGSSHTWGGRCAGFDAIDFEERAWVPFSGWPIGMKEIIPYLDRSADYLGLAVGSGFSDQRFWDIANKNHLERTSTRNFCCHFSGSSVGTMPNLIHSSICASGVIYRHVSARALRS